MCHLLFLFFCNDYRSFGIKLVLRNQRNSPKWQVLFCHPLSIFAHRCSLRFDSSTSEKSSVFVQISVHYVQNYSQHISLQKSPLKPFISIIYSRIPWFNWFLQVLGMQESITSYWSSSLAWGRSSLYSSGWHLCWPSVTCSVCDNICVFTHIFIRPVRIHFRGPLHWTVIDFKIMNILWLYQKTN